MTDTDDADRRFAHNLFTASDDEDQGDEQDRQVAAQDDGRDDHRRYAADLFARDDEDAPVLAGLTSGRTAGRTTPPRRDLTPNNEFRFS
jgi:hypothetical protein